MIFAGIGSQISKTKLPQELLGCVFDKCYRSRYICRNKLLYWDMTPFSFANHYRILENLAAFTIRVVAEEYSARRAFQAEIVERQKGNRCSLVANITCPSVSPTTYSSFTALNKAVAGSTEISISYC